MDTRAWAIRLDERSAPAAVALRSCEGMRGCFADGVLWIIGESSNELLQQQIRQVAPVEWFIRQGDQLIPAGCRLPLSRQLPAGPWMTLAELLSVKMPTALQPPIVQHALPIRLIRSIEPRPAAAVLVPLDDWCTYCATAPAVRLRRLHFAATADHALVRGTPLPPLAGERMWIEKNIALPCGWEWRPAVDADTLRRSLRLQSDDLAVLLRDDVWYIIPAECFTAATRSAARRTQLQREPR